MSLCSPHLPCLPCWMNCSATHLLKPLRPKPLLCPASVPPELTAQDLLGTLLAPLLLLSVFVSAISQSPVSVSPFSFFPPLHQTKVLPWVHLHPLPCLLGCHESLLHHKPYSNHHQVASTQPASDWAHLIATSSFLSFWVPVPRSYLRYLILLSPHQIGARFLPRVVVSVCGHGLLIDPPVLAFQS